MTATEFADSLIAPEREALKLGLTREEMSDEYDERMTVLFEEIEAGD